ncbi:MAG: T9SS type A sorting domain-containing protein [Bacteroidales bacterium]|nr:T9SS type A sorting domain-containing protein [Bacteroidales bacterium]
MKTKLIALIVLLLITMSIEAKTNSSKSLNTSFAPVGTEWHYGFVAHLFGPVVRDDYYHFISVGDTLIQGKLCNTIVRDYGVNMCRESAVKTFLYQSNDTVFLYVPEMTKFTPLYVFGANTGDSWIISHPAGDVKVTVDSVSTVSLIGAEKKQQFVTYHYNWETYDLTDKSSIIEGVGDFNYLYNYLIYELSYCDDYKKSEGLRCYTNPDLGSHHWTDLPCDRVVDRDTSAKPYLGDSDSWLISSFSPWSGEKKELSYVLKSDTVVNLLIYKKVYASNSLINTTSLNYLGGIRETKGKWHYLPNGEKKEFILYDFSLVVGDTLSINFFYPYSEDVKKLQVIEVDSVYHNGEYRKRIGLGEYNKFSKPVVTIRWFEGIGSDQGLFYNPPGIVDLNDFELICYHHNSDLVYINSKYNSCSLSSKKEMISLNDGDSWSINVSHGSWYGGGTNENYTVVGEKSINGLLYKNVVVTSDSIYNAAQSRFAFNIREDKGKWFYYNSTLSKEVLLYDFNLQVGDSIIASWSGLNVTLKVMKVDSLLLNGEWRKRLQMGQHDAYYGNDYFLHNWIEGIGSDDGILYSTVLVMDSGSTLLCFHRNGELVYINPNFNRCGLISGIENHTISTPFMVKNIDSQNGIYEIQCGSEIEELSITDLQGRIVSHLKPYENNAAFSLIHQPKGVYILQVASSDGKFMQKIVRN